MSYSLQETDRVVPLAFPLYGWSYVNTGIFDRVTIVAFVFSGFAEAEYIITSTGKFKYKNIFQYVNPDPHWLIKQGWGVERSREGE